MEHVESKMLSIDQQNKRKGDSMSAIEFRWAARGGDALVAASGSGAAGRKGRGTVGARVPSYGQAGTDM